MKKIALVHDYIKEYGGAERVLEVLHALYPDAPVYTLLYAPQFLGPHRERFASWNIKQSFLQYIPYSYKFISIYRLLAPVIFKLFTFDEYDVIIVSATGAYNPNCIRKGTAKQICYCHTPPRYLYGYATAREQNYNFVIKGLVAVMNHVLRMVDYMSAQQVDLFIANSNNIAKRIKKFYARDAIVIYPPAVVVDVPILTRRGEYYLAGGRLARPKHIDLIIQAANKMNIPVKIFGKGFAGYGDTLQALAGKTVEFVGEISDEEKRNLMVHAKAFLFAAEDEDFGIVPVEAMSVGLPVIAYQSGGVIETIIAGKTGLFFDELTVESLIRAIKHFEKVKINSQACYTQAKRFSLEAFTKQIQNVVGKL